MGTFPWLYLSAFFSLKNLNKNQQKNPNKSTPTHRTFLMLICVFLDFFFFSPFTQKGEADQGWTVHVRTLGRLGWLPALPQVSSKIHAVTRNKDKYYLSVSFSSSCFFTYNSPSAKSTGQSIWKCKSDFPQRLRLERSLETALSKPLLKHGQLNQVGQGHIWSGFE